MSDSSSQSQMMRSDWERVRWWIVRTMLRGVCGLWLVVLCNVCTGSGRKAGTS